MRLCLVILFALCSTCVISDNFGEQRSIGDTNFFQWMSFFTLWESIKQIFSIMSNGDSDKNSSIPITEDAFLNISQLAAKYGYNFEEHQVTSEDGYILSLHRIFQNDTNNGKVVFLMHGLIDSSDSWILQGPNRSLGYILADENYDVWLGNARGNKYSLGHNKLSNKEQKYWRFTWEEIGLYDLPAMIDFVLNVTQKDNLYYVGHSQGTTTFYVMLSMRPEYNGKIAMMFALSPIAYMSHVKSPVVRLFSPANSLIAYWLSSYNIFSPSTDFLNLLFSVICSVTSRCGNLLHYIIGNVSTHIDETFLPVVFGHLPSGSSTLQFVHFGQLVQSGRFCRYDFGPGKNMKIYGTKFPPIYNLSNVETPVVLFYSGNDWLSDPIDVKRLESELPNVYQNCCYIEDYNHADYMYAMTAKDLIYDEIIRHIDDGFE